MAPAPASGKHSVPGSASSPEFNVLMVPALVPTPGKIAPSPGGHDSGSRYLVSGNFCMALLLTSMPTPGKYADSGSD